MTADVRAQAARVLAALFADQGSLAKQLPLVEGKVRERDRALLRELCYGSARTAPRLQLLAQKLLRRRPADREIEALLLLGLYQLEYTRIPDHAAISATVNAARELGLDRATGLINGVLRSYQRSREQLQRKLSGNPQFSSAHPEWLWRRIKAAWPERAGGDFPRQQRQPADDAAGQQRQDFPQ